MPDKNVFQELYDINVNDKVEKKNGLSYLSWAWAWAEVKKRYPDTTYKIYENSDGLFYHTDGKTAWVKTGVTVVGIEYIEYLPVMDNRNRSIPVDSITSFDVNKTIQRSLTKALARAGLGLYVFAGEDLPESVKEKFVCDNCGKDITGEGELNAEDMYDGTFKAYGKHLCANCGRKEKEKKVASK